MNLQRLFMRDSIALVLFGVVITGVINTIPKFAIISLEILLIGLTVYQAQIFIRNRIWGLAIIKIAMLAILLLTEF